MIRERPPSEAEMNCSPPDSGGSGPRGPGNQGRRIVFGGRDRGEGKQITLKERIIEEVLESHAVRKLAAISSENENKPVEHRHSPPGFERIDQVKEKDTVGCVIACFRMVGKLQGGTPPSQEEARKELARRGFTNESGEVSVDETAARVLGVKDAQLLPQLLSYIDEKDRSRVQANYPELLTTAIDLGYVATISLPYGFEHGTRNQTDMHAVVVDGMRYENGQVSFLVQDPLSEKNTTIELDTMAEYIQQLQDRKLDAPKTIIASTNQRRSRESTGFIRIIEE